MVLGFRPLGLGFRPLGLGFRPLGLGLLLSILMLGSLVLKRMLFVPCSQTFALWFLFKLSSGRLLILAIQRCDPKMRSKDAIYERDPPLANVLVGGFIY